jgi:hypothetical protein
MNFRLDFRYAFVLLKKAFSTHPLNVLSRKPNPKNDDEFCGKERNHRLNEYIWVSCKNINSHEFFYKSHN